MITKYQIKITILIKVNHRVIGMLSPIVPKMKSAADINLTKVYIELRLNSTDIELCNRRV